MESQKYSAYSLVLIFDHKDISNDRIYLNFCVCVLYTHTLTCDVICLIMCIIDLIKMGSETPMRRGPETWEKGPKEKKIQGKAGKKQAVLSPSSLHAAGGSEPET